MEGGSYIKKTSKAICEELGDEETMMGYIEEYGNTSTSSCSVIDLNGCTEKEVGYIAKMKEKSQETQQAQLDRLEKMIATEEFKSSIKPEDIVWFKKRIKILKQFLTDLDAATSASGEL